MQRPSSQLSLSAGTSTRLTPERVVARSNPGKHETFARYAERWLESIRGGVRPRTYDGYSAQLRLHLLPLLGDRLIADLEVEDVLKLISGLRSAGYTPGQSER